MSIATEIQRLQQAKSDLKTSIQAKGVTVSSEAKLDDYPDLVDSIQTGGDTSAYIDWFEGNTNIIPNGPTELRSYSFCGQQDKNRFPISTVSIPPSVTHLNSYCFYNFNYGGYSDQSIIIPDTVTSVDSYCFYNVGTPNRGMSITMTGVTELTDTMFRYSYLSGWPIINPSITEFPHMCFYNCNFIEANSSTELVMQIPSQIKTIKDYCFYECDMKTLIIPDTVETISANRTFASNYLNIFKFLSPIPPTLIDSHHQMFYTSGLKIYVPDEAVDTYKSTDVFSIYASYIHPASEMPA